MKKIILSRPHGLQPVTIDGLTLTARVKIDLGDIHKGPKHLEETVAFKVTAGDMPLNLIGWRLVEVLDNVTVVLEVDCEFNDDDDVKETLANAYTPWTTILSRGDVKKGLILEQWWYRTSAQGEPECFAYRLYNRKSRRKPFTIALRVYEKNLGLPNFGDIRQALGVWNVQIPQEIEEEADRKYGEYLAQEESRRWKRELHNGDEITITVDGSACVKKIAEIDWNETMDIAFFVFTDGTKGVLRIDEIR